jgi:hypothetical protein
MPKPHTVVAVRRIAPALNLAGKDNGAKAGSVAGIGNLGMFELLPKRAGE